MSSDLHLSTKSFSIRFYLKSHTRCKHEVTAHTERSSKYHKCLSLNLNHCGFKNLGTRFKDGFIHLLAYMCEAVKTIEAENESDGINPIN